MCQKIWDVFFLVKMWYILNYYISNFLCCPKQIAILLVTHIFTKSCLAKANSTIIHVYARYFFFKILIPSINVPFQLSSRFPDAIARLLPGSGRYQILYTDYDNFAILWSCANFGIAYTGIQNFSITPKPNYNNYQFIMCIFLADQIWVLGRDKDFDAQTRKIIYDALEQLGFGTDRLVLSRNKNCPAVFKWVEIIRGDLLSHQTHSPTFYTNGPVPSIHWCLWFCSLQPLNKYNSRGLSPGHFYIYFVKLHNICKNPTLLIEHQRQLKRIFRGPHLLTKQLRMLPRIIPFTTGQFGSNKNRWAVLNFFYVLDNFSWNEADIKLNWSTQKILNKKLQQTCVRNKLPRYLCIFIYFGFASKSYGLYG